MPKVLIADKLSPAAVAIFNERGVDADVRTGLSREELLKIVDQYDGIAIRSATKITADVIKAAKNLKVVGRAGIGVDNVDIPAATAAGVIVMNTPFGNSITTAEHAISLMLALARELPAANASTQAGKWEKNRFIPVSPGRHARRRRTQTLRAAPKPMLVPPRLNQDFGGREGRHPQEPHQPAGRQQAGGRGQCLYRRPLRRRRTQASGEESGHESGASGRRGRHRPETRRQQSG